VFVLASADILKLKADYLLALACIVGQHQIGRSIHRQLDRFEHLNLDLSLELRSILRAFRVIVNNRLKLLPNHPYFLGPGGLLDLQGVELVIFDHVVETVLDEDYALDEGFDVELAENFGAALFGVLDCSRPLDVDAHLL